MDWFNSIIGQMGDLSTYLVYAAIIIIFAVVCVKCLAPVISNTHALNRAIKAMKHDKGKTVRRKTWEDEAFLGEGGLQPAWRLYLENVFFADSHMQAPCSVEDYINEDSVINVPGRYSLGESMSSVFVSLGFLGTLLGIVISLSTMSLGDADDVLTSMNEMMGGLKYAFGTSIAGVIASIAFTVLNKAVQGRARNTLEEFTQIFQQDTDMPPVDPMTQIATYQQEQTRALATLVNEVQTTMISRIDEVLSANLAPLAKSMESFMSAATFKQVEGVERIVNSFVSHMDQALRGQFQNLARVMDDTCRAQQMANDSMQNALQGFAAVSGDITAVQRASQTVVEKFDMYLASLNAAQRAQDERGAQMSQQIEIMQKTARDQTRYINQIQDYLIKLQKGLDGYAAQTAEFLRQYNDAAAAGQTAMRDASAAMEGSARALGSAAEAHIGKLENNLARMLADMDKALRDVTEQLGWTIASIKESVGQMPAIMSESAKSYAGEMDRFVDSVHRLQRALDAAMSDGYASDPNYRR